MLGRKGRCLNDGEVMNARRKKSESARERRRAERESESEESNEPRDENATVNDHQ